MFSFEAQLSASTANCIQLNLKAAILFHR